MFSRTPIFRRLFFPAMLAGALWLAGCEEKVTKTRNPLTAGPYPQTNYEEVSRRNRQRNQPRGPLESIGDFLFGWTRSRPAPAQPAAQTSGVEPAVPQIRPPEPKIDPVPKIR